jgi:hypothetical protein
MPHGREGALRSSDASLNMKYPALTVSCQFATEFHHDPTQPTEEHIAFLVRCWWTLQPLAIMRHSRQHHPLGLILGLMMLVSYAGECAVLRVPGDHATVQGAINGAAAGDIIEITDSAVYIEDVNIQKSITLRGAAGQTPTIRAANTASRFGHLGIPGADRLGILVRAQGVVLENLRIENMDPDRNAENVSSALSILASNCTVRDAYITTAPDSSGDACGGLVADLDIPLGGTNPTGVLIENTLFETNTYAFASSFWVAPQLLPEVTFRGCTFRFSRSAALELDSGNVTIETCLFEQNSGNAVTVGGGSAEVRDSIFRLNTGWALNLVMDGRSFSQWPAIPPSSARLIRCQLYENQNSAVRVREGTLHAEYSVFALNNGPHVVLDTAGREQVPGRVYITHCDFYKSLTSHELLIEGGGSQEILFDMKNSIVTEADGGSFVIHNQLWNAPGGDALSANYCAFYEQAIPLIEINGQNNLLVGTGEPPYLSTDPTSPDAFRLPPNSPLLTAGEAGTFLGSRGLAVAPQPVTLRIWLDQGSPMLSWTSQNGVTYDVRERNSLTSGDWTTKASVPGDGSAKTWSPTAAPAGATYWQLLAR